MRGWLTSVCWGGTQILTHQSAPPSGGSSGPDGAVLCEQRLYFHHRCREEKAGKQTDGQAGQMLAWPQTSPPHQKKGVIFKEKIPSTPSLNLFLSASIDISSSVPASNVFHTETN